MGQKKCFKCNETKDLSLFYKHRKMGDGHLGKCKECTKKDVSAHRNANLDKIRQYDRERGKLPHRLKKSAEITRKRRKQCPQAYLAHCMVATAIKGGRLIKPKKCSGCDQEKKLLGHHDDYYKPLDVKWLCQVCHKQVHKTLT